MKKLIYIISLAALFTTVAGCNDDFLEQKNLYQLDEQNFYKTTDQMNQALYGVYSPLQVGKGFESPQLVSDILSDDCFAGGGPGDVIPQDMDVFEKNHVVGMYDMLWKNTYEGIYRANKIIENIDVPEWSSDEEKNQLYGEVLFLRAYYNFRLGKFWGQAPLMTDSSLNPNQPKASGDEIFAQVATDLKKAIEIMPNKPNSEFESGHATKWAAEALMARAFLFYTGYYNKPSMPLNGDAGAVSKVEVQNWLVDLIEHSGHELIPDFRNIWSYSHNKDYPYATANNLNWIGEGPENTETIFAVKFSPYAVNNANTIKKYSNQVQLFIAPRGNPENNQFGKGWGFATVNSQLWDTFESGDIRREATLLNSLDKVNESPFADNFSFGRNRSEQETGFFNKKYLPVLEKDASGKWKGMFYLLFGGTDHFQLWNMADQILIRYSDVLLMAAELECPNAQLYFDKVRMRSTLASKAATLENIKEERRHELALEGIRYHDLLRWHDVESAFAQVVNVDVYNGGLPGKYTAKYRPETGGFLPIPINQISLSAGVLTQNPGW